MKTYTELGFYPNNEQKIVRFGIIQGDHNIIAPIMGTHLKTLERKKESYCFELKDEDGNIKYVYSLKNSELESYKKYIPNFK